jgi:hypothetical protein
MVQPQETPHLASLLWGVVEALFATNTLTQVMLSAQAERLQWHQTLAPLPVTVLLVFLRWVVPVDFQPLATSTLIQDVLLQQAGRLQQRLGAERLPETARLVFLRWVLPALRGVPFQLPLAISIRIQVVPLQQAGRPQQRLLGALGLVTPRRVYLP